MKFRSRSCLGAVARCCTVVALVGSAVAACGGSGSGGSGSNDDSTILVGGMASLNAQILRLPQSKAAQEAAIADINASGGVNRKQLKLDFCDTKYEVSGEINCMRKLIADGAAVIVNPNISVDTGVAEYQAAEAANVAVVGPSGYVPTDFTGRRSFPASSGAPGLVYGAVSGLVEHGAKNIAILGDNNPTSQYFSGIAAEAVAAAGLTPVRTVIGDVNSDPSLETAAAKAITGTVDGVFVTASPTRIVKSIPALRKQGYKGLMSTVSVVALPEVLKTVGAAGEGVLTAAQQAYITDTANPGIREFLDDMKKYAPGAQLDENALLAWSAVKLFAKVASSTGASSRADILKAFTNLSQPADIGTLAPYKVVGASPVLGGKYPRMFNPTVQLGSVQGGALVADGKGFVDPFTALANAGKK